MIWERIRQADEAERKRLKEDRWPNYEERKLIRVRKFEVLVRESQLLEHLTDLKNGIPGKKDITYSTGDYEGILQYFTLVWGRYDIPESNKIVLNGHPIKCGGFGYSTLIKVADYSYIIAGFDVEKEYFITESLASPRRDKWSDIPREEWRGNQDVIINSLVAAYRSPNHIITSEEIANSRSSSSDISTECCCSS